MLKALLDENFCEQAYRPTVGLYETLRLSHLNILAKCDHSARAFSKGFPVTKLHRKRNLLLL
jgi:hypothetical protein